MFIVLGSLSPPLSKKDTIVANLIQTKINNTIMVGGIRRVYVAQECGVWVQVRYSSML